MNNKTKIAIIGSIEKWKHIVNSLDAVDKGNVNCNLCIVFNNNNGCGDCPVAEKTGYNYCKNTPYSKWVTHHIKCHTSTSLYLKRKPGCKECLEIAEEEVKFLRSLLDQ